ncbi:MAG: PHP domain-containing protein [Chloroflexi bacterium]|nr:MAG: PHP domain-containing protein [Chloroflexota bacterium]
MEIWRVELHAHTIYSRDCLVTPEQIIAACRRKGIHRIVITDHNTIAGALRARELAPAMVIVGEEIMTTQGELLAFFVEEEVPPGLPPQETITRLRAQGAVISVSHPYDRLRKGAWREEDLRAIIEQVDALEVFNARCIFPSDNARALALAQHHDRLQTVGSDAHTTRELGRALIEVPPFDGPESFKAALAQARLHTRLSSPFIHFASTYAKWVKRLGLR